MLFSILKESSEIVYVIVLIQFSGDGFKIKELFCFTVMVSLLYSITIDESTGNSFAPIPSYYNLNLGKSKSSI